jgi:hypothetical protein
MKRKRPGILKYFRPIGPSSQPDVQPSKEVNSREVKSCKIIKTSDLCAQSRIQIDRYVTSFIYIAKRAYFDYLDLIIFTVLCDKIFYHFDASNLSPPYLQFLAPSLPERMVHVSAPMGLEQVQ